MFPIISLIVFLGGGPQIPVGMATGLLPTMRFTFWVAGRCQPMLLEVVWVREEMLLQQSKIVSGYRLNKSDWGFDWKSDWKPDSPLQSPLVFKLAWDWAPFLFPMRGIASLWCLDQQHLVQWLPFSHYGKGPDAASLFPRLELVEVPEMLELLFWLVDVHCEQRCPIVQLLFKNLQL